MAQAAVRMPGFNSFLRELRGLDKEFSDELRSASQDIATRHMVPAWKEAAESVEIYGARIAATIKAIRDRVPGVQVGGNRKVVSGGATANMLRYPTHAGPVRDTFPAVFTNTEWMKQVKPDYIGPAMNEYGDAVERVVDKFNRGRDF